MKKLFLAGLASIAGVMLAGAAMAHTDDVDVMMIELQPNVSVFQLSLSPDGDDLLMTADVFAEIDVVPDSLTGAAVANFQLVTRTDHLATRGGASDSMVDDAMRLWRVRAIDAFTVSPDLLI